MSRVSEQYEAYPYPARDPADEAKRLITGSPSHPLEIDHFIFGGKRDWSRPLHALVAGGGTGDALIQMAAVLSAARRPYEITYLDPSRAARRIAEARVAARRLRGIRFVTGSLLDAPELGRFDYIDCCGVLHHLAEPQAGFDKLAAALTPQGGLGLMVYAPYGRSGVYPLQEAFGALSAGMTPHARLKMAKAIFARVPEGHPFRCNPHLGDHEQGDAGFYDLLLHARDRPFSIGEVLAKLAAAGLSYAGSPQAWLYDLEALLPKGIKVPKGLDAGARMEIAEKLRGTIKTHVLYAVRVGCDSHLPNAADAAAVPHLKGASGTALARQVGAKGALTITMGTESLMLDVPKGAAKLLAQINGKRSLDEIRAAAGLDPLVFGALWRPVHRGLCATGVMLYSRLLV